jgi:hypothetical protein
MRMDIENSPGARVPPDMAPARDYWGPAGSNLAAGDGEMTGLRFCSMGHSSAVHGECVRRSSEERSKGILWRHSSFDLVESIAVEPRCVAPSAA